MFHVPRDNGWVEVIVGPMFSGKTEELIRRLRRAKYAKQQIAVFKPSFDDRFSKSEVVSRNQAAIESVSVENSGQILALCKEMDVVAIDEVQFFDAGIVDVVEHLANNGTRVIVAGLDLDYKAEPFDHVSRLMALAEHVTKSLAICVVCGNPAGRSQRLSSGGDDRIVLGDIEAYEARCRKCFKPWPDTPTGSISE